MAPASTGRTGDGHQGRVPPRPGREVPRQRPAQDRRISDADWDDYATPPRPQRPPRPPARDPLAGSSDPWERQPPPRDERDGRDGGDPRQDTSTHVLPDAPGVAGRGRRRKADGSPSDTGEFPRQDHGPGDTGQFTRRDRRPGDTGQYPQVDRRPGDTGQYPRVDRRPGDTGEFTRPPRRPGDTGEFSRPTRRPGETGEFSRPTRRPGDTGEFPRTDRRPGDTGQFSRLDSSGDGGSARRGGVGTLDRDRGGHDDDDDLGTFYDSLNEPEGWRAKRRARREAKRARLTYAQLRLRRNIKVGIAAVMLGILGYLTVSVGGALTAPGQEDAQARLAGWARDHGLGSVVSWLENQQYQAHPPKSGGQLSQQDLNSLKPSDAPSLGKDEHVLPPLKPFLANPAPDEGVWEPAAVVNGVPVVQVAKLRSDPVHTSYLSAVAWIDQKHASFVLHPGVQQPGDPAAYKSTSYLSGSQLKNLIATWNGGFMLKPNDAHGGFYLNGKTYGKLVSGQASEVFKKDGSIDVGAWGQPGYTLGPDVVGVRQNLPLLVDNGQVNPSVDSSNKNLWGVTVNNAFFVWRSGVGVTANGDVVYAMGPTLSVRTLAELLQRAGAVRAMELDINYEWVSFMTYDGPTDPANPTSAKLLDFARTARRYFSTEERDFVAVYWH